MACWFLNKIEINLIYSLDTDTNFIVIKKRSTYEQIKYYVMKKTHNYDIIYNKL